MRLAEKFLEKYNLGILRKTAGKNYKISPWLVIVNVKRIIKNKTIYIAEETSTRSHEVGRVTAHTQTTLPPMKKIFSRVLVYIMHKGLNKVRFSFAEPFIRVKR